MITLNLTDCSLNRRWNHPESFGQSRQWSGLAWKPDGSVLYASADQELLAWDPATQRTTVLCSGLPSPTLGLEYHPDQRLLGSSGSAIFEIDPVTCVTEPVHTFPDRRSLVSLTFKSSG